jgi:hypothetical protein
LLYPASHSREHGLTALLRKPARPLRRRANHRHAHNTIAVCATPFFNLGTRLAVKAGPISRPIAGGLRRTMHVSD